MLFSYRVKRPRLLSTLRKSAEWSIILNIRPGRFLSSGHWLCFNRPMMGGDTPRAIIYALMSASRRANAYDVKTEDW